jgi:hypothetical protein
MALLWVRSSDPGNASPRKANELLNRTGPFWQTEYWDRFIRNEAHFHAIDHYIDSNPVKAKLVAEARLWPYGSARLKDLWRATSLARSSFDRRKTRDWSRAPPAQTFSDYR